jgi:hypothetical protein
VFRAFFKNTADNNKKAAKKRREISMCTAAYLLLIIAGIEILIFLYIKYQLDGISITK